MSWSTSAHKYKRNDEVNNLNGRGRGLTNAATTVGTVLFGDVWKDSRATSEMMDVLIDEQEMPEPVRLKLRAICVVPDEWEKLGRIRHQRTT